MTSPLVPRKSSRTGMKEYELTYPASALISSCNGSNSNLDSPILKVLSRSGEIVKPNQFRVCVFGDNLSPKANLQSQFVCITHPIEIATWLILPVAYACLKD
jgi:hypothetical protein